MKLQFKEHHPLLLEHFNLCEKRILKLYLILETDPFFLTRYNDSFLDQIESGIKEPPITYAELRTSEIYWLGENLRYFDKKRLRNLMKNLNLLYSGYK